MWGGVLKKAGFLGEKECYESLQVYVRFWCSRYPVWKDEG